MTASTRLPSFLPVMALWMPGSSVAGRTCGQLEYVESSSLFVLPFQT